MKSIFSIDVEDWFHILDVPATPAFSSWDSLPSRVEKNFNRLLDILEERDAKATCFFLGYIGQRFPQLVREAARRGHEVASHGFTHTLAYEQTAAQFQSDVARARKLLEDTSGGPVRGYRSPGFSATERTPWFFDELIAAGYGYDSSVFPAPRGHGGMKSNLYGPHVLRTSNGTIIEFPISVEKVLGRPLCFFGGGYLRLYPYPLVRRMARSVLAQGRPPVFYVHPREIDPKQPRLPMSALRRFKTYVNLDTAEPKIRALLRDFPVETFAAFIARDGMKLEEHDVWTARGRTCSSTTTSTSSESTGTPTLAHSSIASSR